jgi:hypothetical protein
MAVAAPANVNAMTAGQQEELLRAWGFVEDAQANNVGGHMTMRRGNAKVQIRHPGRGRNKRGTPVSVKKAATIVGVPLQVFLQGPVRTTPAEPERGSNEMTAELDAANERRRRYDEKRAATRAAAEQEAAAVAEKANENPARPTTYGTGRYAGAIGAVVRFIKAHPERAWTAEEVWGAMEDGFPRDVVKSSLNRAARTKSHPVAKLDTDPSTFRVVLPGPPAPQAPAPQAPAPQAPAPQGEAVRLVASVDADTLLVQDAEGGLFLARRLQV